MHRDHIVDLTLTELDVSLYVFCGIMTVSRCYRSPPTMKDIATVWNMAFTNHCTFHMYSGDWVLSGTQYHIAILFYWCFPELNLCSFHIIILSDIFVTHLNILCASKQHKYELLVDKCLMICLTKYYHPKLMCLAKTLKHCWFYCLQSFIVWTPKGITISTLVVRTEFVWDRRNNLKTSSVNLETICVRLHFNLHG